MMEMFAFSPIIREILVCSRLEADRLHCGIITPEHLLLGIIRNGNNSALDLLLQAGADVESLRMLLETNVEEDDEERVSSEDSPRFVVSKATEQLLGRAIVEAKLRHSPVGAEHLLLAFLHDSHKGFVYRILDYMDIDYKKIDKYVETEPSAPVDGAGFTESDDDDDTLYGDESGQQGGGQSAQGKSGETRSRVAQLRGRSETPVLDKYGKDITRDAEDDKLDPVVGREREIERLAQILSRRKKNITIKHNISCWFYRSYFKSVESKICNQTKKFFCVLIIIRIDSNTSACRKSPANAGLFRLYEVK